MTNSSTREIVARIIDPQAFSHLYRGNRDEAKWLANKKRAIEAAIRKADAVLAIIAAPVGGEVVEAIIHELGCCDVEVCGNSQSDPCAYRETAERIARRLAALTPSTPAPPSA